MYSSRLVPDPGRHASARRRTRGSTASAGRSSCGPTTTCWRSAPAGAGSPCTPPSRYGCRVTTTTISREQRDGALRRIADAGRRRPRHGAARGLPRPARPLRQARLDRDDRGGRLAVLRRASSAAARSCSTPDGLIFLQAIVIDDRVYELEKAARSFSNALIFPGGCLPSVEVIQRCIAAPDRHEHDLAGRHQRPLRRDAAASGASASSPTTTSPPSSATTSPSAASGPCGWR